MWPWEHAIVGYLAYSFLCRLLYRDSPGGLEALAVVFASTLPDLIDKPLAWQFGLVDSGYAIGHSVFFATALGLLVGAATRGVGRPRTGLAFAVGYLLHMPGDVFYHYTTGSPTRWELALWPVRTVPAEAQPGLFEYSTELFVSYVAGALSGGPSPALWFQLTIAGIAFLVWLADGAPVLRELLVGAKRLLERPRDAGR